MLSHFSGEEGPQGVLERDRGGRGLDFEPALEQRPGGGVGGTL